MSSERPYFGLVLLLIAVFFFACLEATAKLAATMLPPVQVVWARYAVHAIAMAVVLLPFMGRALIKSNRPFIQISRSLLLAATTVCQFTGLSYLQLTEVTVINFAAPFLVTLLAVPLLGERPGIHRWSAILIGFSGVLIMMRPGFGTPHWSYFLILAGTGMMALYIIATRVVSRDDNPIVSLFFTALLGAFVMSFAVPFVWIMPPSPLAWACLVGVGVFGAVGHFLLIIAARHIQGSLIAPFMYTQIIWSVLFGVILFGDLPDQVTWIGASVVIAGGLYLAWREALRRVPPSVSVPR